MLVLSRRVDESIDIYYRGAKVATVLVAEIRGNKVRIGLDGGTETRFVRHELLVTRQPDDSSPRQPEPEKTPGPELARA